VDLYEKPFRFYGPSHIHATLYTKACRPTQVSQSIEGNFWVL
jgi:hypothetical protein